MNNDDQQDLNAGNHSPSGGLDEKQEATGKRKRRPSEAVRFKARLKDLADVGIIPHAVWFDPEGGFELRLNPESNLQTDEYEDWFAKNISEEEK